MIKIKLLLSLILVLFLIAGCSIVSSDISPIESTEPNQNNPYILNIQQEASSGKQLFVKGVLNPNPNFTGKNSEATKKIVKLKTIKNGEIIGEAIFKDPIEDVPFTISADSDGFTDYQIDLLWGMDAIEALKSLPVEQFIDIQDLHLSSPDINGKRYVEGLLVNKGVKKLTSYTINLQFIFLNTGEFLDLQSLNPENDTPVEVSQIEVAPGESKPFSIEIDSSQMQPTSTGDWHVVNRR
jgi:hypothetical protein